LKILHDRLQRNLRPYGAACEMYGLGHDILECQSKPNRAKKIHVTMPQRTV
jgi:hypothetical protein